MHNSLAFEDNSRAARRYNGPAVTSLRLAIVISLLTVLMGCADDGDAYDAALQIYERGEYESALKAFQPLAEEGDMGAQFRLGWMYAGGEGLPEPDTGLAVTWFKKAAAQDFPVALFNLGAIYRDGLGDERKDYKYAADCFRKAANLGYDDAQHALAMLYQRGLGVLQDADEAVKWYRKAAEAGYGVSQYVLGETYFCGALGRLRDIDPWGSGTEPPEIWYTQRVLNLSYCENSNLELLDDLPKPFERDYVQAHKWFSLAAVNGVERAVAMRRIVEELLTPEEVTRAKELARAAAVAKLRDSETVK